MTSSHDPEAMGALQGLGPALARLRETRQPRVTKAEMARRLGVTDPTVLSFEREDARLQSSSVERYLDALGCTLHDLARALDEVNGRPSPITDEGFQRAIGKALASLVNERDELRDRVRELTGTDSAKR